MAALCGGGYRAGRGQCDRVIAAYWAWRFAAGHWWQTRNRQPVWWLVNATGALLVLSPLIYFGQRQLRQIAWVPKPGEIPGLTQQEAWTAFPDGTDIAGSIGLGGLLLGLGLVGAKFAGRAWGMLLAWALGLKLLLYLVSMYGPQSYWVGRYLYFVTPAFVLLAALTLSWLDIRHTVAVLVVFALLAVPLHSDIRSPSGHNSYDGLSVVNYLTPRLQPGDVALFGNSGQHGPRDLLRYYGLPTSDSLTYWRPKAARRSAVSAPQNVSIRLGVCPAYRARGSFSCTLLLTSMITCQRPKDRSCGKISR